LGRYHNTALDILDDGGDIISRGLVDNLNAVGLILIRLNCLPNRGDESTIGVDKRLLLVLGLDNFDSTRLRQFENLIFFVHFILQP
jgi:hypothetical protein